MSWSGTALKISDFRFILFGEGQIIVVNMNFSQKEDLSTEHALSAAENIEKVKEVCNSIRKWCHVMQVFVKLGSSPILHLQPHVKPLIFTLLHAGIFTQTFHWLFYVWMRGFPLI